MSMISPQHESTSHTTDSISAPGRYKHTDAGEIPDDWGVSSVGAEFDIQLGKMLDAATNVGTPKMYVGNRSVQWGRIDLDESGTVPMTPADLVRFRLRLGDLLVCEGGEIGRAAIWDDPIPECYYQKALHRLRPTGSYDAYLMMSLLHLWTSNGHLANYVTQTSIAHLPKDKLAVVPLPVPPPAEQRAIARTLSGVDALLKALETLIAKKRAIKQAVMQQLFTGATRLPGFSGDWQEIPLSDVADRQIAFSFVGGPFGSNLKASEYTRYGVRIIQLQNIGDGHFNDEYAIYTSEEKADELKSCNIFPGEIIISKMGDPVARACLIPMRDRRYLMASDGIRLAVDRHRFSTHFVHEYINSPPFRSKAIEAATGSTRTRIGLSALRRLPLRAPGLAEQEAIAAVLSDMSAEIGALERQHDKIKAIKQGMAQQLLAGRVRLLRPAQSAASA